jgi:hypothetical protein
VRRLPETGSYPYENLTVSRFGLSAKHVELQSLNESLNLSSKEIKQIIQANSTKTPEVLEERKGGRLLIEVDTMLSAKTGGNRT